MSQHLIPVKTGNEQFPVSYRTYLPALQEYKSIVSTIAHRVLYIAAYVRDMEDKYNGYVLKIYAVNLLTWQLHEVGDILREDISSTSVGGILVDDSHIYLSSISQTKIFVFTLDTLELESTITYSSNAPQAYGKMQWLNEETICMSDSNGVLLFDTITRSFTFDQYSYSHSYADIAAGSNKIVMNRGESTSNSVIIYNTTTDTFSTLSLTSNDVAVSAYENGKFYIANTAYLYIVDASTMTVEKTISGCSWSNPRSISATNGAVFVSCVNSAKIYIYDTNTDWNWYVIAPWTLPTWDSSKTYVPSAAVGLFFYPYLTLCQMDYTGQSKYNFGPISQTMSVMFNESTEQNFTYDSRFVEFTESYVTVKDGSYTVPLQIIDPTNHIKSASIHKSDYAILKKLMLKQSDE